MPTQDISLHHEHAVEQRHLSFTASEWRSLAGLYGFIALLHVVGWGIFLYYSAHYPALIGLGFVA